MTYPYNEGRRDRPWIFSREVQIGLMFAGLLAAILMRNPLAILGWIAATCGAWGARADRQRDVAPGFGPEDSPR